MGDCQHCSSHAGVAERLQAQKDEIILRFSDLERRLGALNELRAEVTKDRQQFLRLDIYTSKTDYYDKWITSVEKRLAVIETRSVTWTAALGVIFLLAYTQQ